MKKILLFAAFISASYFVNAQDVTNGLVSKYTFDNETIEDAVSGIDGTNSGGTFRTSKQNFNQAIAFTGGDDNQIAKIEDPIIDMHTGYSISVWFYVDSFRLNNNSGIQHIITSRKDQDGFEAGGLEFSVNSSTENLSIIGRKTSPFTDLFDFESTPITEGEWNHVVFTYNPSQTNDQLKLYLNGSLDEEMSFSGDSLTQPVLWNIGASEFPFDTATVIHRELQGAIDELRFYNKALSSSEISQLYNFNPATVGLRAQNIQEIELYPNPTSDFILVEGLNADSNLSMVDLQGKKVNIVRNGNRVELGALTPGAYFMQIENAGAISVGKVIIK